MRFATNTAIAVAPKVISSSHLSRPRHGTPCGGKSVIGNEAAAIAQRHGDHQRRAPAVARHHDRKIEAARRKRLAQFLGETVMHAARRRLGHEWNGAAAFLADAKQRHHLLRHGSERITRFGGPSR